MFFEELIPEMARIPPAEFMTTKGIIATFRSPYPREAKAVLRLMQRSYAESPYLATLSHEFDANPRRIAAWIESHAASPGKLMIVAEYQGALIAMIDFSSSPKRRLRHVGEFGLSVAGPWQRCGIGRALLQSLITWVRASAVIEKIELQVFSENLPAINLYQTLGFREEGRRRQAIKYDGEATGEDHPSGYMDLILMGLFVRD
jgi:RimJ/RimL family protein N-acetyltransferase